MADPNGYPTGGESVRQRYNAEQDLKSLRASVRRLAERIGTEEIGPIPADDAPAEAWDAFCEKIFATVERHWDAW